MPPTEPSGILSYHTLPRARPRPASLLDHLLARFPRVDRETWILRLEQGQIAADDGRVLDAREPYREGLRIRYRRDVPGEPDPALEIGIVHEDERILVVDKPAGIPVVPAGEWVRRSLLHRLLLRTGERDLSPAHRIDRETAGLVLFVRRKEHRGAYQGLFAERRIHKVYEAEGGGAHSGGRSVAPPPAFTTVRSRIVRTADPFRWASLPDPEGEAETDVYTVGPTGRGSWRFHVVPRSGRPHQVRLHLDQLGFSVAGDSLYPRRREPDPARGPLRLLARELAFRDPLSREWRFLRSRLGPISPEDG